MFIGGDEEIINPPCCIWYTFVEAQNRGMSGDALKVMYSIGREFQVFLEGMLPSGTFPSAKARHFEKKENARAYFGGHFSKLFFHDTFTL